VSFATDIIDMVCVQDFEKQEKFKSAFSLSAVSTVRTSATQHCRKTH